MGETVDEWIGNTDASSIDYLLPVTISLYNVYACYRDNHGPLLR
jgi:hypothetical protein